MKTASVSFFRDLALLCLIHLKLYTILIWGKGSAPSLGLGEEGQPGRSQDFLAVGPRQGLKPTYPDNIVSALISCTLFWEN